jgi:predicted alpha/beta-fold hydrolase
MNEKSALNAASPEMAQQWADLWQSFSASSKQIAEAWSSSMAPFMLARLLEPPGGFAAGNEMSDMNEKMAQGPRLADAWDIDRKIWFSGRGWKCAKSWQALAGSFVLSGSQVDLKSVTAPVLNVFALDDHIIPPDCSRALGAKIGSTDYTEMPLPGGHVGLFVSSKSQGKLSQSIADWLLARDANAVSEA